IEVLGGPIPQSKEVISAGIYLSSSDPLSVFATGEVDKDLTLSVVWRNGTISVIQNLKANRIYEIDESSAYSTDITHGFSVFGDELFSEDVSNIINDLHRDDKNNDLIVGNERGTPGVFHNDDKGQFHHNED
ncbi:MAG: ASPIC/UnbV domain-containing protein, partial [Nitrospinaceae bacterium]